MNELRNFPPQQLSFSRKTKKWRKQVVDWGASKTFFNCSPVRKSEIHKKINYDLVHGTLHMDDLMLVLNPNNIDAGFIPDKIQHYPIMNSKLEVLKGEELKRVFDYRVVVTNPNAVSEIERNRKQELTSRLQQMIADTSQSEEQFNSELERLNEYITYEWQDEREIRANALLNHYVKEYNMPLMFNDGFMDGMAAGEEIYQCDIVGGEPMIWKLDPNKIKIFRSGTSNKVEDADMIIYEDYWSPGRIIDTFYDSLTQEDMKYIEKLPDNPYGESGEWEPDPRLEFIPSSSIIGDDEIMNPATLFSQGVNSISNSVMPYDTYGNIRVVQVYWKSRRKIKKVKSYNMVTGEEEFNFYPENYVIDEARGEEEQIFWINEAWEGTKIGEKIYVNMRPRPVQYNRLSSPSRCHFGIVGSIYNINGDKPFSLVDRMKPYSYLYDVIHDRMNRLIARNKGKVIQVDLAKVPSGWDLDKYMYFLESQGIAVVDSFNEGIQGAARGKLAGGLNNNSTGIIDMEFGTSLQSMIQILAFIKDEMSEVAGISKQREGQISNRETVGGVERATLQSSHITEWWFAKHDDVKRRALECFLETAKIAMRGKNKKFQYILSDNSMKMIDIDGDVFAEDDYGLVVDNSNGTQELQQKLDGLAQAALQNQALRFSTMMKLYGSSSLAEKQRMVEKEENDMMQRQQEAQQQQAQLEQEKMQAEAQAREADMQLKDMMNQRDNETKVLVATISANSSQEVPEQEPIFSEESKAKLAEQMRQFDSKMKLEKDKLDEQKRKNREDERLKLKQINKPVSKAK